MNFAYIGAILAALLLIGFSVAAVILVAKSVQKSIRERTLDLISDYDSLLEKKSAELHDLEQRKASLVIPEVAPVVEEKTETVSTGASDMSAVLRAVSRLGTSAYRDSAVGEMYQKIRAGFQTNVRDALSTIPEEELAVQEGPATGLLRELPFQSIYELSSLSPDEQLAVLTESLKDSAKDILQTYCSEHPRFDSIGFYDYLKQVAGTEPASCKIRVSPYSRPNDIPEGLVVEEDPEICEGFQLVTNRHVYDYSVKIREIS